MTLTTAHAIVRYLNAQAIGVVNDLCHPRDRIVAAAGGLPAEVTANWKTSDIGTVDALLRGSACASITVTRPGCAPALPDTAMLEDLLATHPGPTSLMFLSRWF